MAGLVVAGVLALGRAAPRAGAADDDPAAPTIVLDPAFYEQRIAPIVHENCAECHANPRKRLGKHFLVPAKGRKIRERHHRRNLETLRRYITPGDPSSSLWLLKALGPAQGGVEHGGKQRIRINSPEYGAMVDWINGASIAPTPFTPPPHIEGEPDFRFFVAKVAPILAATCAECHAGRGKGRHKLIVAEEGEALDLAEQAVNFETILKLVVAGDPERSRLLQKPLATADGGLKHKGGDLFARGDGRYAIFEAFIRGEAGPPLQSERPRSERRLTSAGLVLEAEDLELAEGVDEVEDAAASGYYAVEPLEGGGRVAVRIEVVDEMAYRIVARVAGGTALPRLRVDATVDSALHPVDGAAPVAGWRDLVPLHLVDDGQPLREATGSLALVDGHLQLDGRQEVAGFLVPDPARRNGCEVAWLLPDDDDGGDDALLLYDALDVENARFVGLVDGGRRLVMGELAQGVPRVQKAMVAPEADDPLAPRTLRVERFGGVAVASLDGRPRLFVDLADDRPTGTYGVRTHGRLEVTRLSAVEAFEVATAKFAEAPVVWLAPGPHAVVIELPDGAGRLDQIRIEAP
jgi:mono/diheme cytochrome c family protein